MPELPEVTTVIKYLQPLIEDKIIINVKFLISKVLKNSTPEIFNSKLKFQKILKIARYGKNIIFNLEKNYFISHLRMEGKYYFYKEQINFEYKMKNHIMFIIFFSDNSQLSYCDTRRFGTLHLYNNETKIQSILNVGLEPYDKKMTPNFLFTNAKNKKKCIKTYLLNQKNIAGIGNLYADEILFSSQIHPLSIVANLSLNHWKLILYNTIKIFNKAIELGGTTIFSWHFGDGIDGKFKQNLCVYSRKDLLCVKCNYKIQKIFINNRGTTFCPNCQKKY